MNFPHHHPSEAKPGFGFFPETRILIPMRLEILALSTVFALLTMPSQAQRDERRSLLESDPAVVYLSQTLPKPIKLKVIKEAPVYSDKEGNNRLGFLKADQTVQLEAITDKAYRVRGKGTHDGIAGWVAPWAFSSTDPDFVENLKSLYTRQIQVQQLIADQRIAVGMTLDEVNLSRGKPTKTSIRRTADGQSGSWEYIEYDDVNNYVTEIDRSTGIAYRRLVSVTRVETGKTRVEFRNDAVTAIEESEDKQGGNVRIIVPPLVFGW
jgi:hypothetical protein